MKVHMFFNWFLSPGQNHGYRISGSKTTHLRLSLHMTLPHFQTKFKDFYGYCCSVARSCMTFCDSMAYGLSHSSVHGILQARILEWVAIPLSRGSSQSRDWSQVSSIAGRFLCLSHQGSPRILEWVAYPSSGGSSWPRNQTGICYIAEGFFTSWATREALGVNIYLWDILTKGNGK